MLKSHHIFILLHLVGTELQASTSGTSPFSDWRVLILAGLALALCLWQWIRASRARSACILAEQRAERLQVECRQLEKAAWEAEARATGNSEDLTIDEDDLKTEQQTRAIDWFSSIYEAPLLGVARLDAMGRFLDANKTLQDLLDYNEEELLQTSLAEVIHQDDNGPLHLSVAAAPVPERHAVEGRLLRKEGEVVWCRMSLSLIESDGPPTMLILILDITVRRELELELGERARELARSNRELEQFALTASHDMNEPLDKIVAFGALLDDECAESLSEDGKEYLDYMCSAARRMQSLITSLFELAQVSVKSRPSEPVDMNLLLADLIEDFKFRIEELDAKITIDPLPTAYGDATQLRQLMQNLLGNALKFHFPETPPTIHIRGRGGLKIKEPEHGGRERNMCRIAVQDDGIGFDKMHQERIFNAFQRLHPRAHFDGTGIGLAICRKIVERHNGYIFAKSNPGEGATFRVVLPEP